MPSLSRIAAALIAIVAASYGLTAIPRLEARASIPLAGPGVYRFPRHTAGLFRLTATQNVLQAVNTRSLADVPGRRLRLGSMAHQTPWIAVSADGSKIAMLYQEAGHHKTMALQVLGARSGKVLTPAQHPAVPLAQIGVSPDGSLVYGFWSKTSPTATCPSTSFSLLDTHTGRLVRRLHLPAPQWNPMLVSPDLSRLYTLTSTDHLQKCGPQWAYTPVITAYDLHTGHRIASIRLKGILAGAWFTARRVRGEQVIENWQPGIALSPDGSQLAVLDGHENTLTLIDARSLRIAATEPLTRPQSRLDMIAAALGLGATDAEAKGQINGENLQIHYTPNGRSLIVTGSRLVPDRHHLYGAAHSLGIRLIDIATGRITASVPASRQLLGIWPAPDGSAIYTEMQNWSRRWGWSTILQRRDPATLRIAASRPFHHMGNWWLNLYFLRASQ